MPYQSRVGACEFPGCDNPIRAKRLCLGHYEQSYNGKPLSPLYSTQRRRGTPPRIRFIEQPCSEWGISKGLTTPCRIFVGTKDRGGYGSVSVNGSMMGAHLYVWQRDVGPVPDGEEVDHVCRVRPCINAEHMRTVSHQVNCTENVVGSQWMLNASKTHCIRGHEFTPENTRYRKEGGRTCRACMREHMAAFRRRKK